VGYICVCALGAAMADLAAGRPALKWSINCAGPALLDKMGLSAERGHCVAQDESDPAL